MTDIVILAAGRGSRLMPLTSDRPKAMVEVLGKPIIKWLIDALPHHYYVYVISGYKDSKLKSYLRNNTNEYIEFVHQRKRTGTADAVNLVKKYMKDEFLVLAGDTIFNKEHLKELAEENNSLLFSRQYKQLHEFGTIEFDEGGIKHIHEKSTTPVSNYINCSAYHFDTRLFKYIPKTPVDPRFGERIITNTINEMLDDDIKFNGIFIPERNEISYPDDIEVVEARLRKGT